MSSSYNVLYYTVFTVNPEEPKKLYFEAQAMEVWICNEQGDIIFYNEKNELTQSLLVPYFPQQIKR